MKVLKLYKGDGVGAPGGGRELRLLVGDVACEPNANVGNRTLTKKEKEGTVWERPMHAF